MAADGIAGRDEVRATRLATGAGRTLAASMPRLILEARKIAATVIHGLHGRRRAGSGENFWQFRRYVPGEKSDAGRQRPSYRWFTSLERCRQGACLPSLSLRTSNVRSVADMLARRSQNCASG